MTDWYELESCTAWFSLHWHLIEVFYHATYSYCRFLFEWVVCVCESYTFVLNLVWLKLQCRSLQQFTARLRMKKKEKNGNWKRRQISQRLRNQQALATNTIMLQLRNDLSQQRGLKRRWIKLLHLSCLLQRQDSFHVKYFLTSCLVACVITFKDGPLGAIEVVVSQK